MRKLRLIWHLITSDCAIVIWTKKDFLWGQGTKNLNLYVCRAAASFIKDQIQAEEFLIKCEEQLKSD